MIANMTATSRHERSYTGIDRNAGEVTRTVEQRTYLAPEGTVAMPPGNRYAMIETVYGYRNGHLKACNTDLHLIRFVPEDVAAIYQAVQPRILAHRKQYRSVLGVRGHLEDRCGWPDGASLISILNAPGEEELHCDGVKFVPGMIGPKVPTPEIEAAIMDDARVRFGIITEAILDPTVVAQQVSLGPWVKDRNIGPYDLDYVEPEDIDDGWCDAAR